MIATRKQDLNEQNNNCRRTKLRQAQELLAGWSVLRVMCAIAVLAFAMTANAQLANSGWAKFRGNASNSGLGLGQGANGTVKWFSAAPSSDISSPSIGPDGTIYIGSGLNLLAFDGTTGTQKWAAAAGGVVDSSPAVGADGTVYFGSFDSNLYAVNGATGAVKWAFNTGGTIFGAPAIGPDGTVYIGTLDGDVAHGHLYAVNPANGTPFWGIAKQAFISTVAFAQNGAIYVGNCDNNVYALNPANGNVLWAFPTAGRVESAPAVGPDGSVYVMGDDGFLYAINGTTGAGIWNYNTTAVIGFSPSLISSPAIGANGIVYVGADNANLYAVNAATGALVWSHKTGASVQSSPAVGPDGTVYLGPDDGNIYAINGLTGGLYWGLAVKGTSASSIALGANGMLYVGDGVNVVAIQSITGIAVTLNPVAVAGGGTVAGMVSLNNPAPPNGALVALASNNPGVSVPASVVIAGGASNAYFTVNTLPVNSAVSATISASTFGLVGAAKLLVAPIQLVNLTLATSTITGGSSTTGTVTLSGPAAPGGAVVSIYGKSPVSVPTTVLVPAGQVSATFPVGTIPVGSATTRNVYAIFNGTTFYAPLTVIPPTLASISVNPTTVGAGGSATGTATLTGPAPKGGVSIKLKTSATYVKVPFSVTINAGNAAAIFSVSVKATAPLGTVNIIGYLGTTTQTAKLTIGAPQLESISLNPTTVRGGTSSTGMVALTGKAPKGGMMVSLSSSSGVAKVQSTILIPAGASSQIFTVKTKGVTSQTMATITATVGAVSLTKTLTINPVDLKSLRLSPGTIRGGFSSTGTVTIDAPAPTGGITIALATSDTTDSSVPSSVTIAQGRTSATFKAKTNKVNASTVTKISASLFGYTLNASLRINKP